LGKKGAKFQKGKEDEREKAPQGVGEGAKGEGKSLLCRNTKKEVLEEKELQAGGIGKNTVGGRFRDKKRSD